MARVIAQSVSRSTGGAPSTRTMPQIPHMFSDLAPPSYRRAIAERQQSRRSRGEEELQRRRQPPRPVGFAVPAALLFDVAQSRSALTWQAAPIAREALLHQQPPEPPHVAQGARAFRRPDIEVDAA